MARGIYNSAVYYYIAFYFIYFAYNTNCTKKTFYW
jgi:hypothetical protein